MERRKRLVEMAFVSGLDSNYVDVIEAMYFDRKDVDLIGFNSGGLEEELRISNTYREQYLNKDPLRQFQIDAERVCS